MAEAANGHAATATLKPRRRCTKAAAAWQPAGRRVCMAGGVVQRVAFLARFRRLMFPHDTSPEHLKQYNWYKTVRNSIIVLKFGHSEKATKI